jgi:hypothetical protein
MRMAGQRSDASAARGAAFAAFALALAGDIPDGPPESLAGLPAFPAGSLSGSGRPDNGVTATRNRGPDSLHASSMSLTATAPLALVPDHAHRPHRRTREALAAAGFTISSLAASAPERRGHQRATQQPDALAASGHVRHRHGAGTMQATPAPGMIMTFGDEGRASAEDDAFALHAGSAMEAVASPRSVPLPAAATGAPGPYGWTEFPIPAASAASGVCSTAHAGNAVDSAAAVSVQVEHCGLRGLRGCAACHCNAGGSCVSIDALGFPPPCGYTQTRAAVERLLGACGGLDTWARE